MARDVLLISIGIRWEANQHLSEQESRAVPSYLDLALTQIKCCSFRCIVFAVVEQPGGAWSARHFVRVWSEFLP